MRNFQCKDCIHHVNIREHQEEMDRPCGECRIFGEIIHSADEVCIHFHHRNQKIATLLKLISPN